MFEVEKVRLANSDIVIMYQRLWVLMSGWFSEVCWCQIDLGLQVRQTCRHCKISVPSRNYLIQNRTKDILYLKVLCIIIMLKHLWRASFLLALDNMTKVFWADGGLPNAIPRLVVLLCIHIVGYA